MSDFAKVRAKNVLEEETVLEKKKARSETNVANFLLFLESTKLGEDMGRKTKRKLTCQCVPGTKSCTDTSKSNLHKTLRRLHCSQLILRLW